MRRLATRVKELDDSISSTFSDTVIIHMGAVDEDVDLSASEILNVADVYRTLVVPFQLGSSRSIWKAS